MGPRAPSGGALHRRRFYRADAGSAGLAWRGGAPGRAVAAGPDASGPGRGCWPVPFSMY